MTFRNRTHAAELLARRLQRFAGEHPLILAIPRGAVPMARIIADSLGADLDVALVHKLRAPTEPELAIGSVDESGQIYLTDYARECGVPREYVQTEKERQVRALAERRKLYTPIHRAVDPAGRSAILVDDGVATGATMMAAIHSVRRHRAAKVIVATAVAPPDTIEHLENEADEVVVLSAPSPFYAIGQFFQDFPQVTDEEVIEALAEERHMALVRTR